MEFQLWLRSLVLPLSEIYYERNELVRAAELIERYLPMASEFGFVDQLTAGYSTKARLALLDCDQTLAEATLARGLEVARAREFDRLRSSIVAELMRILTLAGDLERARELALAEGITGSRERWLPNRHTTIGDEARAFAWTRLEADGGLRRRRARSR